MTALFIVTCAVALLTLLGLGVFIKLEATEGELTPRLHAPLAAPPRLSVVIPARNEEAAIGGCLASVLAQDYPNLEVVLVNDGSTDRTGEIAREIAARDARLRVLDAKPLPAGWMGKCHALWQGVAAAEGEWLLFIDADGELREDCLSQAVADAVEHGADLFTLVPTLVNGSLWEEVVHPLLLMGVFAVFPRDRIADPKSSVVSANGPFLLFRRAAYERVGGHEAVKAEIVEDLELAERVKASGGLVRYVSAPRLMRVRMYRNFREIWNGWSKNFYRAVHGNLLLAALASLFALAFGVLPWIVAPAGLVALFVRGWDPILFGAVWAASMALLTTVAMRWQLSKYLDQGHWRVAWQPVATVVLVAILWNSAIRNRWGGAIAWKGRTYAGGKAGDGEETA